MHDPTHTDLRESQGFFPRLGAALFGPRIKRLREQIGQAHWLSYLLIISQSIAVVLVFGHAEVMYLTQPSGLIRALAIGGLFVLIINVIAADMALIDTMLRIPALRRNRQAGALFEHRAYQFFVLAVEGMTYGIVIYALDSDPQALFQGRSLVPTNSLIFLTLVLMRVVLLAWTLTQLIIVREKLPVLLSTLMNTGKEIVGGHLEEQLKALNVRHIEPHALMSVYAEMGRPPRPIAGLLNALTGGWIVNRALAQEAEEERQAANVITALERIKTQRPPTATDSASALDTPTSPALPAAAKPLSRREARRAALAADMYGVRGHPTSPRLDHLGERDETDEDDGPDWAAADIDWDDDDWAAAHAKGRPNMSQHIAARRNGSSAARVAPRFSEMVVDLPEGKTERRDDSPEAKKVMRYLDKHPGAKINDVVQKTGVSRPTVRRHYTAWIERNKRVDVDPAPFTEEMPAIISDQLAERV